VVAHLWTQRPQQNITPFAKANIEVKKKKDEGHIKYKKARHTEQYFLITAKKPPLFRKNKSLDFLPPN
jgi:hypothetical protein